MKRNITAVAALLAAAVTVSAQRMPSAGRGGMGPGGPGGPGRGFGPGMMMGAWQTPITGAPFSAVRVLEEQQVLANGNQINRKEEVKVYRDGQGRMRNEETRTNPAGQAVTNIVIFDPVAGFMYRLNPAAKTAVQGSIPTRTPGSQPPQRPPRPGADVQTTDLGTQTINGLPATGTRVTETIAAGAIGNQQPIQVVRETWTSTVLKVPVLIKTSDPRFGTRTMQLTNVVQAEPDPALFQVPSDYTVTKGRGGMGGGMMGRQGRPPRN